MINLPAADIGNDAVRTRVIAAPHNRDESRKLVIDCRHQIVEILVGLSPVQKPLGDPAEVFNGFRSNDEIQKRKPILEVLFGPLRRAPCHHDLSARPPRFPSPQPSNFRKCAIFGVLTHGTGIHQKHRCLIGILGLNETFGLQMPAHLAGVRHIHLAPVRVHVKLHSLTIIYCSHRETRTKARDYMPDSMWCPACRRGLQPAF